MIDTVRFNISLPPQAKPISGQGWIRRQTTHEKGSRKIRLNRFAHKPTGIRLLQNPQGWSVEVSLPRALHGSNSRLLKSQADIDAAITVVRNHVKSATKARLINFELTRVDLCWHVPGRIVDFIAAHELLTHPETGRGKVIIYRGESIIWESRGRRRESKQIRMQMYDKRKQKTGRKPGTFVRLEIQLRGEKLKEHLGNKNSTRLNFEKCYRVLRKFFLAFPNCRLYELYPKKVDEPARDRLEEFGIRWHRLLPKAAPKVKTRRGYDLPVVPRY